MISQDTYRTQKKGFTLIEALVLLFIFSVTVVAFYSTYTLSLVHIVESKKRLAAVGIANERLETLRNTPYEDIALDPGSSPTPPSGSVIFASAGSGITYEVVEDINEVAYRIRTEVYYVDDEQDLLSAGGDTAPNDYKEVIMTIFWGDGITDDSIATQQISLSSLFIAPSGNESAVAEGALAVNVVDSDGNELSGFTVSVADTNGATLPDHSDSGTTDSTGNVLFTGVPSGEQIFRISISRAGYESITTLPPYPTTAYYPTYVDVSIIGGTLTTVTMIDDLVPVDFDMTMSDPYCNAVGGLSFDIEGGRILGYDTSGDPVFVNSSFTATGDAVTGIADIDSYSSDYTPSAGDYEVTFSEAGYTFWKLTPGDDINPYATFVDAGATHACKFIIMDNTRDSVIVTVTDTLSGSPMDDATVRLRSATLAYDVALQTDIYGKAFFPNNELVPLQNGGEYVLTVSEDGYAKDIQNVTVTGLEQINVVLTEL